MTAIENLPARMAEVIGSHEWTAFPRSAHNQHNYYGACAVCQRDIPRIAEVACGVRDELVAHLSARVAAAEAKVGHAEAGAQLSSERLAEVRQELAEAKATIERTRALDDVYPCGSVYVVPYGSGGWREVLPAADLRAALSASAPSEVADV